MTCRLKARTVPTRRNPQKPSRPSIAGRKPPRAAATLYLASANAGKLREFREAAKSLGLRVEPVPNIQDLPICVEDGDTFEANARKKALHYSAFTDGLVFADDSGICVDALGGAPGVFSARYAGEGATDIQNNAKLLDELRRIEQRNASPPAAATPKFRILGGSATWKEKLASSGCSAHYVCVLALAERGKILAVVEGRADGTIIDQPRGSGGFGYDPYFFYPPLGKTFAELTAQEKFAVSHRGNAFRKLLQRVA